MTTDQWLSGVVMLLNLAVVVLSVCNLRYINNRIKEAKRHLDEMKRPGGG